MTKESLKKYRDQVINCVDFKIVNSTTLGMLNAHIAGTVVFRLKHVRFMQDHHSSQNVNNYIECLV